MRMLQNFLWKNVHGLVLAISLAKKADFLECSRSWSKISGEFSQHDLLKSCDTLNLISYFTCPMKPILDSNETLRPHARSECPRNFSDVPKGLNTILIWILKILKNIYSYFQCIPYLKQAKNPHILNLSPPLLMEPRWFSHHVGMSFYFVGHWYPWNFSELWEVEKISVNIDFWESLVPPAFQNVLEALLLHYRITLDRINSAYQWKLEILPQIHEIY